MVDDMQLPEEAVRLTQWLTTYTTPTATGEPTAGLAFIASAYRYNPQTVAHNDFYIIYPRGFADEHEQQVQAMVRDLMRTSLIPADPAQRRTLCIQAIDTIIKFVSERNNTVSSMYQVGCHHATEGARISEIANTPEEVILREE